jgi:hypothetical protein
MTRSLRPVERVRSVPTTPLILLVVVCVCALVLLLTAAPALALPAGYPKLGLWWPSTSQSLTELARYDWITMQSGSANAALRALHPDIVLLADVHSGNACEAILDPTAGKTGANANIAACSPRWALTQAGTRLSAAVDATTRTFPVSATTNAAGPMFKVGEPAVIDNEFVRVDAIGTGQITVTRGLVWGAASSDPYGRGAAAHSVGARVAACSSAWTGAITMDMTSYCPSVDVGAGAETWVQHNARYCASMVSDGYVWDGLFIDRAGCNESWVISDGLSRSLDIARTNVVPSNYTATNSAWNTGMRAYLTGVRAAMGSKYIVCNQPVAVDGVLNGYSSEDYPKATWDAATWETVFTGPWEDPHYSMKE